MLQMGFYEFLVIILLGLLLFSKKDFVQLCFKMGKFFVSVQEKRTSLKAEISSLWEGFEIDDYAKKAKKSAAQKEPLLEKAQHNDDL